MMLKITAVVYKIIEWWNNFFFKPESVATIALYRIVFGFVIFITLLGKLPHLDLYYGTQSLVSLETALKYYPNKLLYFLWVPETQPFLTIFFLGLMLATLSLIIGFKTRISSIIVGIGLICISNRAQFIENAGDDFLRINAFILMFTQAGRAYSIDRWMRVKKGLESATELPKVAPWATRLLQMQLAYLYWDTAYLKLAGPSWIDGTAMYYAMGYWELRRFDFKFLFDQIWKIKMMTYTTLIGEFSLATIVWFRKFRYICLAVGFTLHWGINMVMQFPVFQYVMMSSLVTFLFPEDVERAVNWARSKLNLL